MNNENLFVALVFYMNLITTCSEINMYWMSKSRIQILHIEIF